MIQSNYTPTKRCSWPNTHWATINEVRFLSDFVVKEFMQTLRKDLHYCNSSSNWWFFFPEERSFVSFGSLSAEIEKETWFGFTRSSNQTAASTLPGQFTQSETFLIKNRFLTLTSASHESVHAGGRVNSLNCDVKASAVQIFHSYDKGSPWWWSIIKLKNTKR